MAKYDDQLKEAQRISGSKIYNLIEIEHVQEAWSCLAQINKHIFAGWWNRTLISYKTK